MVNCCVVVLRWCSGVSGVVIVVIVVVVVDPPGMAGRRDTDLIYGVQNIQPLHPFSSQQQIHSAQHGHTDRVNTASTAPQRTLVPPPQGPAHHGPCALDSAGDVCDGVCDGVNPGRIVGVRKANGEFCVCHAGRKFIIISFFFYAITHLLLEF